MTLSPSPVCVWIAPMDGSDRSADRRLLSPAERERAATYTSPEAAARFERGRAVLRRVLGTYLRLDPQTVALTERPGAAPALLTGGLAISLSRCDDLVLVAVTDRVALGADVERLDAAPDGGSLARAVLPPAEALAVEALPAGQAGPAFIRAWTRREAWLKALGTGLGGADDDPLSGRPPPARMEALEEAAGATLAGEWWLIELRPSADHVAVIAVERGPSDPGPPTPCLHVVTGAVLEPCLDLEPARQPDPAQWESKISW